MTQRTWTEVEISAYLDGELDAETRAVLESAIAQDSALREQVDAMQLTVDLIRAVPQREPPRNYLLSPSMVAVPSDKVEVLPKSAKRRRMPLFVMRWATSLVAVAFVISFGLNMLNVARPELMMQRSAAPEMAMMSMDSEPMADAPSNSSIVATPTEPMMRKLISETVVVESEMPQEDMALAPAPLEMPAEDAEPGLGASGEITLSEQSIEQQRAGPASPEEEKLEALPPSVPCAGELRLEEGGSTNTVVPACTPSPDSTAPETWMMDEDAGIPPQPKNVSVNSLSIVLGFATLVLALITFWLSRKS